MPSSDRILVTGASGQLGQRVIARLLETVPANRIVAMVRGADAGAALRAQNVEVRLADYEHPNTIDAAFSGIDRVLLISSNAIGRRVEQHRNVIEAALRAGVRFLAYTSVLHADRSPLGLAEEHRRTEQALRDSGLAFAILRNGWYTENYTAGLGAALAHNAVLGSAGHGLTSSASREDYAVAAAVVLTAAEPKSGAIFELAGDDAYTLTDFAAEIARQSGQPVVYKNVPQADYKAVLLGAGFPDPVAELIADSSAAAAKGALFDESRSLSRLIGRPTTPMRTTIAEALKGR